MHYTLNTTILHIQASAELANSTKNSARSSSSQSSTTNNSSGGGSCGGSVSAQFKGQLGALMDKIRATSPHYIRYV